MSTISRDELLRLARAGAASRVKELQTELESIYAVFPDLKHGGTSGGSVRKTAAPSGARKSGKKASRAWSASARKAVSDRMKRYWAARRAKTAKTAK